MTKAELLQLLKDKERVIAGLNDRIEELEGKLAKAVDVLGYYARNDDGGSIARTTLAELTGGNDD